MLKGMHDYSRQSWSAIAQRSADREVGSERQEGGIAARVRGDDDLEA